MTQAEYLEIVQRTGETFTDGRSIVRVVFFGDKDFPVYLVEKEMDLLEFSGNMVGIPRKRVEQEILLQRM